MKRTVQIVMVSGDWIKVSDRKPRCPRAKDALGTEVLIFPRGPHGYIQACYGKRATGKPTFYMHGAEIHGVTHWMPLPANPRTT